jgi:hypothetical protein
VNVIIVLTLSHTLLQLIFNRFSTIIGNGCFDELYNKEYDYREYLKESIDHIYKINEKCIFVRSIYGIKTHIALQYRFYGLCSDLNEEVVV